MILTSHAAIIKFCCFPRNKQAQFFLLKITSIVLLFTPCLKYLLAKAGSLLCQYTLYLDNSEAQHSYHNFVVNYQAKVSE